MRVDLHLHSHFSDGRYAPQEVVEQAISGHLDVMAIADHDTLEGYLPALEAAQGKKIHLLQAVECSTRHDGQEVHILAYFPGQVGSGFLQFLQQTRIQRQKRIEQTIENLRRDCHLEVSYQAVMDKARSGNLCMAHLAVVLVELGITSCFIEAFRQFLGKKHIAPLPAHDACEVIALIQAQGGLSFWAHPSRANFDRVLPTFMAAGLAGIEAFGRWPKSTARHYRRSAEASGLLISGGSDWHGHQAYPRLGEFAVEEIRLIAMLKRFPSLGIAALPSL